jgi:hypothetical protein
VNGFLNVKMKLPYVEGSEECRVKRNEMQWSEMMYIFWSEMKWYNFWNVCIFFDL